MTTTPLPIMRIVQPNDGFFNDNEIVVRIERDSDGFVYDANHANNTQRIFKVDTNCQNPWISLKKGQSNSSSRLEASVSLDPKIFLDGDYIINFHDNRTPARNIFYMDSVFLYDGKTSTPRPYKDSEIASRIMQIRISQHKIAGSLGELLNNVNDRLTRVEQKIDAISAKLGIK